ncbi:MAG: tRNA (guanosine(37)-N1)-methyltransferase TrmD [Firmicutes bacterium]|nr:tRNA (guanosine(37)-N1)-methyltransferase TrmD [Candidatus Fiminaster equi]
MKITILTLFPEMFDGFLTNSIIKRAIGKKVVEVNIVNIRDYTKDKYGRVDTPPVGGGAGLIMKCQPIVDAIRANSSASTKKILLSPRGKQFTQEIAVNFAKNEEILLLCGHYEGVDERVNNYVDEMISIGDYVLTGGEIGAMAIADAVIRLQDGAITDISLDEESFNDNLLEYPQYTEPKEFEGQKVPDILYTGNHTAIEIFRRKESLKITRKYRPDLYAKHELTKQDKKLVQELDQNDDNPKWLEDALAKGKKFTK